ncbi:MAG TPA: peptide chain release factor N(5)-glutamine methyltransferase [Candidatus Competibacteraceae bacterium]|nr:peptide chain release factor N(5)-glutamine methyltransferase [Candidatus Competibacteraceae bacterium]
MAQTTIIADVLQDASISLVAASDTPRLDAEVLLAHVLKKSRSYVYAWPEQMLESGQIQYFAALLERRLSGEPIAYILGRREFWSLELIVTPATLIPRPETELLVELALERIPQRGDMRIADLGTGSGAIALAIAKERADVEIIATDSSADALAIARLNARRLNIRNVIFRQGDWCGALNQDERFDLIVSNPPYVAASDRHLTDLRFEPVLALVAGSDGLNAIRSLVAQVMNFFQPGGELLLEHGCEQGRQVQELLHAQGFIKIQSYQDAAGKDRVTGGRRPLQGR